jgi:threonine dehydrogenase-like Zn-dependent dehydrogenase
MRAAIIAAPGRVCVEQVKKPDPGEGTVRVRLEGCGVCGSNLSPWEGRPWFKYPMAPGELGHEGWGVVDALGPKVSRVKIGQRVAMLSYRAYAEYDVAAETDLVPLPKKLDGQPFPGEPLACAMNIFQRSEIQPDQVVAIVGIGFLGALLTQLCSQAGAKVVAISRRPFALEMAQRCGAVETIALKDHKHIIERVVKLTHGRGCDRVIEAVGCQEALDLATDLTRERGRLIIAGYHQDGVRQINMQLWNWRGLDVINAHERDQKMYVAGMQAAVGAVASGRLDPSFLYTHRFSLEQLDEAFDAMRNRPDQFLKALITI